MRAVIWAMNNFYANVVICVQFGNYLCEMLFNIYCLYDSITRKRFYVGCTINDPKKRLSSHLNDIRWQGLHCKGIPAQRGRHVLEMEKLGSKIIVRVLRRVPCEEIDYWERYYHDYYISRGHPIIQSVACFNYISSRLPNVGKKVRQY